MQHYGDFRPGQTVRLSFNSNDGNGLPASLTSGTPVIRKNGVDVTPSGGVTFTIDAGGVVGLNELAIDTSVDAATFAAGSDFSVRLPTGSSAGGASTVGMLIGGFSILNRSISLNASGQVNINYDQTGLTPRVLDAVADAALTTGDCLVGAVSEAAGKESLAGTAYTKKTPSTGTVIRNFTLDNASAPTSRN